MLYLLKASKEWMELILQLELAIYKNVKASLDLLYENAEIEKELLRPPYTEDAIKDKVKALIEKAEERASVKEIKETYRAFKKDLRKSKIEWGTEACDRLFLQYFPVFKTPVQIIKLPTLPISPITIPEVEFPKIEPLPIPEPILIDDEIRFGNNLLKEFPDGLTAIFYEIDDAFNLKLFKEGAARWAREQKAIGFIGARPTLSSVKIGHAMPEYIQKKSAGVGVSITSLGTFVKKIYGKSA